MLDEIRICGESNILGVGKLSSSERNAAMYRQKGGRTQKSQFVGTESLGCTASDGVGNFCAIFRKSAGDKIVLQRNNQGDFFGDKSTSGPPFEYCQASAATYSKTDRNVIFLGTRQGDVFSVDLRESNFRKILQSDAWKEAGLLMPCKITSMESLNVRFIYRPLDKAHLLLFCSLDRLCSQRFRRLRATCLSFTSGMLGQRKPQSFPLKTRHFLLTSGGFL